MGAKQSSPATNGRTRAYSGSDLPSNTASSNGSNRSVAGSSGSGQGSGAGVATALASGRFHYVPPPPAGPRSMATSSRNQSLNIPNSGGTYSSQEESEGSTPEESTGERPGGHGAPRLLIGSLPAHLSPHLFGASESTEDARTPKEIILLQRTRFKKNIGPQRKARSTYNQGLYSELKEL
ncbi:E3 ubiquitin-protein ligase znrf2 isoform X3 [Heterodontus francisci]|uniref:E3 ubiquitin-protein ligase znrf2 isoform X3 n=1 Tax=Heterodontus francisci TaxID=7792 RepID=UPI00355B8238